MLWATTVCDWLELYPRIFMFYGFRFFFDFFLGIKHHTLGFLFYISRFSFILHYCAFVYRNTIFIFGVLEFLMIGHTIFGASRKKQNMHTTYSWFLISRRFPH